MLWPARLLFRKPVLNCSKELIISRIQQHEIQTAGTHLISLTQPVPPSLRSIHGIGYGLFAIKTDSLGFKWHIALPSTESSAGARESGDISWSAISLQLERRKGYTSNLTTPCPGSITVRKLRLLGAMGVSRKASASGCEMGPPAESE
jgi:hypothetical protein